MHGYVRVLLERIRLVKALERPLDDPHPQRGRARQRHLCEEESDAAGVSRCLRMFERRLRIAMLQIPVSRSAVQVQDGARLVRGEFARKELAQQSGIAIPAGCLSVRKGQLQAREPLQLGRRVVALQEGVARRRVEVFEDRRSFDEPELTGPHLCEIFRPHVVGEVTVATGQQVVRFACCALRECPRREIQTCRPPLEAAHDIRYLRCRQFRLSAP